MLDDDGTCNYTCANYGDFGTQDDLTQCMIYDHNPWVWNIASAGLLNVSPQATTLLVTSGSILTGRW